MFSENKQAFHCSSPWFYIDIENTHSQKQLTFQNWNWGKCFENERNFEIASSCQFAINLHLPFWVFARFKRVSIWKQSVVGYLFSLCFLSNVNVRMDWITDYKEILAKAQIINNVTVPPELALTSACTESSWFSPWKHELSIKNSYAQTSELKQL